MSTMLYIQTDKNVKVEQEEVYLKDIAALSCGDPAVLARMQALKVRSIGKAQYGRYPVAMSEIVEKIQKTDEKVDITHIGAPDFIITFEDPSNKSKLMTYAKVVFVCLVTFFGTAFSIMTFNNDVNITTLFQRIHESVMGAPSDGATVLEISYSIGIGVGAVFFFNHFGNRKITEDPTPMEVEMRTYEDSVDTTIIEQKERKQQR